MCKNTPKKSKNLVQTPPKNNTEAFPTFSNSVSNGAQAMLGSFQANAGVSSISINALIDGGCSALTTYGPKIQRQSDQGYREVI